MITKEQLYWTTTLLKCEWLEVRWSSTYPPTIIIMWEGLMWVEDCELWQFTAALIPCSMASSIKCWSLWLLRTMARRHGSRYGECHMTLNQSVCSDWVECVLINIFTMVHSLILLLSPGNNRTLGYGIVSPLVSALWDHYKHLSCIGFHMQMLQRIPDKVPYHSQVVWKHKHSS